MIKIINTTPHPVNLILQDGKEIVFHPEFLVRVKSETISSGNISWHGQEIPLTRTLWGHVEGLPELKEDVLYIVSQLIKDRLPDRKDLLVPSEIVRNDKGHIIGCKAFSI
jgi:hypothetical protein